MWTQTSVASCVRRNLSAFIVFILCLPAYYIPDRLLATHHNPPVGVYISIMGLLAAVVTFLKPETAEKAAWIVLLTLLMVAEIRNLYIADAEQLAKFNKVSDALDATKKGLEATARGIGATADTLEQDMGVREKQFSATMRKAQAGIDTITGGDSFVVIYPDFTDSAATTFPLVMHVCNACRDSVPDATVLIRPFSAPQSQDQEIFSGTVGTSYAKRLLNQTVAVNRDMENEFMVTVFAPNRPTFEHLKVRFNHASNEWEASWQIQRETKRAHYNPKTRMAEGVVLRIIDDMPWTGHRLTPVNPAKVTVTH